MTAEEKLIMIRCLLNTYYESADRELEYKDGIIDAICGIACFEMVEDKI